MEPARARGAPLAHQPGLGTRQVAVFAPLGAPLGAVADSHTGDGKAGGGSSTSPQAIG